jgi:Tfp pilus assembly protein PilF
MSSNDRVEAFTLVDRAIRIQLSDNGELSEAEACLRRALELDPKSIEVLQEAAHFFDAVMGDADRAREYAAACRMKALSIVGEMDEILRDAVNL